jgi:probable F420-dependent oxidoreductase
VRTIAAVSAPTVGLFAINSHSCSQPDAAAQVGQLAERLGYDSLWAGEHVVVPSPRVEPSPMEPEEPILDPLVALAHLAARTERVRLGTGLIVLPQRNPLVLAKQAASLDVLSGGRLILGMGVGYLEPEMTAIGVPMEARGSRADEYLAAMRSLWQDDAPAYHGKYVDFEGVDAYPRPVQRPLPIVVGGHTERAFLRAARHADGWYGFMIGLRAMAQHRESLRAAIERTGRTEPLHISVSPSRQMDAETVRAYAELGVERLILVPPIELDLDGVVEFVESNAPERIGALPA